MLAQRHPHLRKIAQHKWPKRKRVIVDNRNGAFRKDLENSEFSKGLQTRFKVFTVEEGYITAPSR